MASNAKDGVAHSMTIKDGLDVERRPFYWATCKCGWNGYDKASENRAVDEFAAHVAKVLGWDKERANAKE